MLLGIAYHATYAWLPDVARWYFVADASTVPFLVSVTGALHAVRMEVFFALSGFFAHLVLERRGTRGFFVDRARRLLVPLAVAWPLVLGLDTWLRRTSRELGLMSADYARGAELHFTPVHLWFLVYLAALSLVFGVAMRDGASDGPVSRTRFGLVTSALVALTAVAAWKHPELKPDASFLPLPFEVLHYGLFFAFGWLLFLPSWRPRIVELRPFAPWGLAVALALAVFVFRGAVQWQPLGHVLSAVLAWLVVVSCFALALGAKGDGGAGPSAPLRFLVESSYWTYLVHYPVVMALQLVFVRFVEWPGLLEYALTVLGTVTFAFGTFVVLVWRTPLGPWLGVKPRTPAPA